MLKLDKFLHLAEELSEEINENQLEFIEAERKILEFVNKLGRAVVLFLTDNKLPSKKNKLFFPTDSINVLLVGFHRSINKTTC